MKTKPTIVEVAELAGVSTATVSRALHEPDIVSQKTRETVLEAIRSTGYTLNTAAQNLRQNRANAILVLVPNISNTFFSEVLAGIEHVASTANLTVLVADTAVDSARAGECLEYLYNGRADGALLLNGGLPTAIIERIRASGGNHPPILTISEALPDQIVPHIGIDNCKAARLAVEHLLDLGHRNIAHVRGPKGNILTNAREDGYHLALTQAGLQAETHQIFDGDFSMSSGEAAGRAILQLKQKPTAVFCSNDEMAMGLISVLHKTGTIVPDQISVIGFDDIHFARVFIPALTTIRQPRHLFGVNAASALLGLLKRPDHPMESLAPLRAELIIRDSTGPCFTPG